MLRRLWFPLVALFWAAMNVLLWRAEMMTPPPGGSPVSPDLVWERVLTAPDESSLEIRQRDRKLGWLRWTPRVDEDPDTAALPADQAESDLPEGRVRRATGYTILLDGSLAAAEGPQRYRLNGQLEFGPGKRWRALQLRVTQRPMLWEVRADARTQELVLRVGDEDRPWEQRFQFAELSRPESLLAALGLPVPPGLLQTLLPRELTEGARPLALGLNWDARSDWYALGSARTRVFRVSARLLDKYEVRLVLSRVGEILRLELPQQITLVNDALANFPALP